MVRLMRRHGGTDFYNICSQHILTLEMLVTSAKYEQSQRSSTTKEMSALCTNFHNTWQSCFNQPRTDYFRVMFYLPKYGVSRDIFFKYQNKLNPARTGEITYPDCWKLFRVNLEM